MAVSISGGSATYYASPRHLVAPAQITFAQFRQLLAKHTLDVDDAISQMTIDRSFIMLADVVVWACTTTNSYTPNHTDNHSVTGRLFTRDLRQFREGK